MMMISIQPSSRTVLLKVIIIRNLSQYLFPGYDGESKGADSIE